MSRTQVHAPTIIGTLTTYHGTEHAYLRGYQVRILGVLRPGATEDDTQYISDDDTLARSGGVKATDRVDVAPIMEGGRTSFASSDARAIDLAAFAPQN